MCGKFGGLKRLKCLSLFSWRGDTILDRCWFDDDDSFVFNLHGFFYRSWVARIECPGTAILMKRLIKLFVQMSNKR